MDSGPSTVDFKNQLLRIYRDSRLFFRLAGFGVKKFKKWDAKGTGMSDGDAAKRQ
ncbi:hypothetical protein QWY93_04820 [Echinicola jeungdonensis]|uniref:Uncharacterized protein n=1 Tax=Echinicola jeungdonensis TaxID=709343 RepID=A0ABV5J5L7_9BACT|nr:hypothetical protein [Echinicola jeungdonensis]MDN3668646.1 hypothetical protein [Echinicola jeungdonensis]